MFSKLKSLFVKPELKININKVGSVCSIEIEVNKSIKQLSDEELTKICEMIKDSINDYVNTIKYQN